MHTKSIFSNSRKNDKVDFTAATSVAHIMNKRWRCRCNIQNVNINKPHKNTEKEKDSLFQSFSVLSVNLQMNRISRKNFLTHLSYCHRRHSSFWTSNQVRNTFLDFFKNKQHEIGKSLTRE